MKKLLAVWLLLALLLPIAALAYPGEVSGVVTKVADGDTIDVQDFGTVRLADIDCPEMGTPEGSAAKAYATECLQSKKVYLDIDNKTGKDQYGRYVCVVYISKPDGSIDESKNFNRMLVDSGYACVWDFSNNEFNPADWWDGSIPSSVCIKDSSTSTAVPVQPSPSSNSGQFVGSTKSNKYHYPSCQWAQKISPQNEIWFSSSEDARAHNYVACKVCNPP